MASPTIDGAASGTFSTATSGSTSGLTTATANDLAVIIIAYGNTTNTVNNVTSVTSPHLTWAKAAGFNVVFSGTQYQNMEVWTAPITGTLSAEVITAHTNSNVDDACLYAFGVAGLHSTASPFDPNGSLPASTTSTSGAWNPPTFSTSLADDLAIWLAFTSQSNTTVTNPQAPFTTQATVVNSGGVNFGTLSINKASFSATQSNITPSNGVVHPNQLIQAVVVFTADAAAPPGGSAKVIVSVAA